MAQFSSVVKFAFWKLDQLEATGTLSHVGTHLFCI